MADRHTPTDILITLSRGELKERDSTVQHDWAEVERETGSNNMANTYQKTVVEAVEHFSR